MILKSLAHFLVAMSKSLFFVEKELNLLNKLVFNQKYLEERVKLSFFVLENEELLVFIFLLLKYQSKFLFHHFIS